MILPRNYTYITKLRKPGYKKMLGCFLMLVFLIKKNDENKIKPHLMRLSVCRWNRHATKSTYLYSGWSRAIKHLFYLFWDNNVNIKKMKKKCFMICGKAQTDAKKADACVWRDWNYTVINYQDWSVLLKKMTGINEQSFHDENARAHFWLSGKKLWGFRWKILVHPLYVSR